MPISTLPAIGEYNRQLNQVKSIFPGLEFHLNLKGVPFELDFVKVYYFKNLADYPQQNLLVVDYDRLVQDKQTTLKAIFDFVQIEYNSTYGRLINNRSIKKALKLNAKEKNIISNVCLARYETARQQYDHIQMHP